MSWSEVLTPEVLPFYLATLAMLALASVLVYWQYTNRRVCAFRLKAEEELMLANLADRLGLTAMRAIERSSDRPKSNAAAPGSAVAGYKAALRAAMRDGTLTRREERHLAEVAMAWASAPCRPWTCVTKSSAILHSPPPPRRSNPERAWRGLFP